MSEQYKSIHSCSDDISTTYGSVHNIFEEDNSNTTTEWKKLAGYHTDYIFQQKILVPNILLDSG